MNPSTSISVEMTPEISPHSLTQMVAVPQQVDMHRLLNVVITQASTRVSKSMNAVVIGSFAINFVISIGMKKLLQTIRVYQLAAFFVLLALNYPPIAKLVLQAIFGFATFKILPKQAMAEVLLFLGLKGAEPSVEDRNPSNAKRQLEE